MKPLYKLILTITIGSAVFVGGFFVFHYNTPALQQINTLSPDMVLPDGIELVQIDDNSVLLRNTLDGYVVTLEKPKKISYSPGILQVNFNTVVEEHAEGGGYSPYVTIVAQTTSSSVESWVKEWIASSADPDFYTYEKKVVDGEEIYFIVDKFFFGGPQHYPVLKKAEKIFFIDGFFVNNEDIFRSISIL